MAALQTTTGRYGSVDFKHTWRGAIIAGQIDQAVDDTLNGLAADVLATLRSELHVWHGDMRAGAFARVYVRSGRRTMEAGSTARHTIFHEMGTATFEGHPQIREIMFRYIPQVTSRLQANVKKRVSTR